MKKYKVLVIFGTRPEAIKMAPLVKALKKEESLETLVCVTAQHREMLDQVLATFDIMPDFDLDIMQSRQTLTDITVRTLQGMEQVLRENAPDLVLVHGDTTTTFAGALAAFYAQIPIGHVEAGLRTRNKYSPYPEEMNRTLASDLTDLHFAPTALSRQNLLEENVAGQIWVTGNTVIDAFLSVIEPDYRFEAELLNSLDFKNRRVVLLTCHRRENLGENMHQIFSAINDIVRTHDDVDIVFPVHLNPRVRETASEIFGENSRVHLIEPMEYKSFANLIYQCHIVLTDSGGLQEEAPAAGKPVLVLRDTTERPEAVDAGTVILAGTQYDEIYRQFEKLLSDPEAYDRMANAVNPYGDGKACERIVACIKQYFGLGGEVEQFEYRGRA